MAVDCPSCDSEMENIGGSYRCLVCDERVSRSQVSLIKYGFAQTEESSAWWSFGKFLAWVSGLIVGLLAVHQLINIGFVVGVGGLVSAGLFLLVFEIVEHHVHRA